MGGRSAGDSVSHPIRHGSKGRPTPKRGAQRRRRYLLWALARHTADQRQWRGAMALYGLMLNRWSDDDAKGVFPSQLRMADELGCCDRQIRRYLVLLVAAGFLTVLPGKRHPHPDGTWHRSNNLYLFRLPGKRKPVGPADRTPTSIHPPSERKNRPAHAPAAVLTPDLLPSDHHKMAPPPAALPPEPSAAVSGSHFAELRALLHRQKVTSTGR